MAKSNQKFLHVETPNRKGMTEQNISTRKRFPEYEQSWIFLWVRFSWRFEGKIDVFIWNNI